MIRLDILNFLSKSGVFFVLIVINAYGLTNEEILNEIQKIEQSSPYGKCIQTQDSAECKQLFYDDYNLYNEQEMQNAIDIVMTKNDFQEIISPCMNNILNGKAPSNLCKKAIKILKIKDIPDGIFYDYFLNTYRHTIFGILPYYDSRDQKTLDEIEVILKNKKMIDLSSDHNAFKLNSYTLVLLEYMKADGYLLRKELKYSSSYNFEKSPGLNESSLTEHHKFYAQHTDHLTKHFLKYLNFMQGNDKILRKPIYEVMRLMLPNNLNMNMHELKKSDYFNYFLKNSDLNYNTSIKGEGNKYSLSVVIPPQVQRREDIWQVSAGKLNQNLMIEGNAQCKKTGTTMSVQNVWSTNIKSKNVYYDVFECTIPNEDKKTVDTLLRGNPMASWKNHIETHSTYNYYSDSELRAMRQNNVPVNSSSSQSSTQSNSSSSSSSSNVRGMKNIRSSGTYIGYPSWSIECNNGSSRNMFLDRNGHWHANGSTSDMGSRYDSWSKEEVANYICKEF